MWRSGLHLRPGEEPRGSAVAIDESTNPVDQNAFSSERSDVDFGSGALMLAFALFVWTRLRA
jgi:hypothetical protein